MACRTVTTGRRMRAMARGMRRSSLVLAGLPWGAGSDMRHTSLLVSGPPIGGDPSGKDYITAMPQSGSSLGELAGDLPPTILGGFPGFPGRGAPIRGPRFLEGYL